MVGTTSGWRFSRKVMLPVALAIVATVGVAAGFMAWSTNRTDEQALVRETALVSKAMSDQLTQMPSAQSDFAVWDDALQAVKDHDLGWLDDNLGASIFESYGHNRNYILDADLQPVYAMRDGGQVPASTYAKTRATIAPLIEKLRNIDGIAAISAYNNGASADVPSVVDFALIEGRPAMVSVMPMLAESGEPQHGAGHEPIYVSAMLLDDALAGELADQYLFANAHFDTQAAVELGQAAYPLRNAANQTIAWFKWQPDRPGANILRDTLPALIGGVLVAGLIIAALLRNLARALGQLQAERAEAHHRALHDPLTGLGNRTLFHDRLQHALATMSRGEPRVSLLALDLDDFKQVNDTLGHEAGDALLCQVTERLTALLSANDTLVRLGGDEFAIIQTGISTHAECQALARRVIEALRTPFALSGQSAQIGVSIGVVTAPDLAQTEQELVSRADAAMYRAKQGGRNRFCMHLEPANQPTASDRFEQDVRAALFAK